MLSIRRTLESTLVPLAATILVLGPPPTVIAEDAPVAASPRNDSHTKDLEEIRTLLKSEEAARRLADAGITQEAAMARVEKMTPAEVHYLAQRMREDRQAGGDGLGLLVVLLVIILLVVLIVVLLDKKVEVKDKGSHNSQDARGLEPVARGAVLG